MKPSQKERVMKYIEDFGSISSFEAYKDLGITQLGARIWELKKDGVKIRTRWKVSYNRYLEKVTYKEYYLEEAKENERTKRISENQR